MTEQYHKDINRVKSLYEERLARNVGENPRMLYNYTKNFTKPSSNNECLIVEGEKITNPVTIEDNLNTYFASVMKTEDTSPPYCDIKTPPSRLGILVITEQNIIDILTKLRRHKAVGPDLISPHILREVLAFVKPLKILFDLSMSSGILPHDWTDANIC